MNTQTFYANADEAAVIRAVLPDNTAKRLARLVTVPLNTAHCWLYRGLSASRRRQVADALLAEMEKQDVARDSVRRVLVEWAGGNDGLGTLVRAVRRGGPPAAASEAGEAMRGRAMPPSR